MTARPTKVRTAKAVETEFGSLVVGIAVGRDGAGQSLLWSIELGDPARDGYTITSDTGASVIGGVRDFRFRGNRLRVSFDHRAATTLGVHDELNLRFDVSPTDLSEAKAGFRRIFVLSDDRPATVTID